MALLGAMSYTVARAGAGTYVAGEWVDGASETLTITASVQPVLPGERREDLPEGYRTAQQARLYTTADLRIMDLSAQTRGDVVEIAGRSWEVIGAADWTSHQRPTAHRRYLLSMLGVDEA